MCEIYKKFLRVGLGILIKGDGKGSFIFDINMPCMINVDHVLSLVTIWL